MHGASVVQDSSARQLMFNIRVTKNLEVKEVPKSEILKAVRDGFYLGLSNLEDLTDNVIDMRKLQIFSKLYLMNMAEKLENWIERYNTYMKLMVRSEAEKRQLLDDYTTIVMSLDMEQVDMKLYKKADECASRLLTLHV